MTQSEIVQQIHNEFNTAADQLLEEAKQIIAKPSPKMVLAERMVAMGFKCAKEVMAVEPERQRLINTKEFADAVERYSVSYPWNKFISNDQVHAICEKYGLLCGECHRYTGSIPEKNLQAIEAFQLRDEDKQPVFYISGLAFDTRNSRITIGANELVFDKDSVHTNVAGVTKRSEMPAFKICAPRTDFDLYGAIVEGTQIVAEDPIVLCPVKEGYLIVTAWGPEAADESVVNEKFN